MDIHYYIEKKALSASFLNENRQNFDLRGWNSMMLPLVVCILTTIDVVYI